MAVRAPLELCINFKGLLLYRRGVVAWLKCDLTLRVPTSQRSYMKAFTEILSGIIRAGPDCDAYGKPFDFAVAFSAHAGLATIKGLVQPGAVRLSRAHLEAMRQECERLGLEYVWERHKST